MSLKNKYSKFIKYLPKEVFSDNISVDTNNDKAFLNNSTYKEIFDKAFRAQKYRPWKRGIIKITYSHVELGTISLRRVFHSGNKLNIKKDEIGLTINTIQQFCIEVESINKDSVKVTRGSRFLFIWQHPNHLIRMGFKYTFILGIVAILIAIVPIVLSFFQ